jgi:hypothetical protein
MPKGDLTFDMSAQKRDKPDSWLTRKADPAAW